MDCPVAVKAARQIETIAADLAAINLRLRGRVASEGWLSGRYAHHCQYETCEKQSLHILLSFWWFRNNHAMLEVVKVKVG